MDLGTEIRRVIVKPATIPVPDRVSPKEVPETVQPRLKPETVPAKGE